MTRTAAEKKKTHIAKEQAASVLEMDLSNKSKTPPQKQLLKEGLDEAGGLVGGWGCAAGCVGEGCDVGGEDVRYFLKR